jgi:hypothetical protein
LSKIRDRYGLVVFQRFFERIVELCIEAGLVWGKELYFDGTKVRANAALDKVEGRIELVTQHLEHLFPDAQNPPHEPEPIPPRRLWEKYNGQRFTSRHTHWYKRTPDAQVSPTDPHASPMKHSNDDKATLGYLTHYVVDGGKARIILAALVTPASVMDNTPMLDLERWVCFRWQMFPEIAVGDTKYGTVTNITSLEQDGIRAYLPTADLTRRTPFYPLEAFTYLTERDIYLCPQEQALPFRSHHYGMQYFVYRAAPRVCNTYPVKANCTKSKTGRQLHRSFFQDYLDLAASYPTTEAYKKALRKRQVWVEPLFGEAKQWHEGRRFRLRGLEKVNIVGILKGKTWRKPYKPAGGAALRHDVSNFFACRDLWLCSSKDFFNKLEDCVN